MEVRREIAQRTGRDAAIGAACATLERLREKGFVRPREAASDDQTGRLRRAYQVTAEGRWVLDQALAAVARMREGVRLNPGKAAEYTASTGRAAVTRIVRRGGISRPRSSKAGRSLCWGSRRAQHDGDVVLRGRPGNSGFEHGCRRVRTPYLRWAADGRFA